MSCDMQEEAGLRVPGCSASGVPHCALNWASLQDAVLGCRLAWPVLTPLSEDLCER